MNKVINVNKALVTSTVLAVSFILLVGPISITINVAQGNTANIHNRRTIQEMTQQQKAVVETRLV